VGTPETTTVGVTFRTSTSLIAIAIVNIRSPLKVGKIQSFPSPNIGLILAQVWCITLPGNCSIEAVRGKKRYTSPGGMFPEYTSSARNINCCGENKNATERGFRRVKFASAHSLLVWDFPEFG